MDKKVIALFGLVAMGLCSCGGGEISSSSFSSSSDASSSESSSSVEKHYEGKEAEIIDEVLQGRGLPYIDFEAMGLTYEVSKKVDEYQETYLEIIAPGADYASRDLASSYLVDSGIYVDETEGYQDYLYEGEKLLFGYYDDFSLTECHLYISDEEGYLLPLQDGETGYLNIIVYPVRFGVEEWPGEEISESIKSLLGVEGFRLPVPEEDFPHYALYTGRDSSGNAYPMIDIEDQASSYVGQLREEGYTQIDGVMDDYGLYFIDPSERIAVLVYNYSALDGYRTFQIMENTMGLSFPREALEGFFNSTMPDSMVPTLDGARYVSYMDSYYEQPMVVAYGGDYTDVYASQLIKAGYGRVAYEEGEFTFVDGDFTWTARANYYADYGYTEFLFRPYKESDYITSFPSEETGKLIAALAGHDNAAGLPVPEFDVDFVNIIDNVEFYDQFTVEIYDFNADYASYVDHSEEYKALLDASSDFGWDSYQSEWYDLGTYSYCVLIEGGASLTLSIRDYRRSFDHFPQSELMGYFRAWEEYSEGFAFPALSAINGTEGEYYYTLIDDGDTLTLIGHGFVDAPSSLEAYNASLTSAGYSTLGHYRYGTYYVDPSGTIMVQGTANEETGIVTLRIRNKRALLVSDAHLNPVWEDCLSIHGDSLHSIPVPSLSVSDGTIFIPDYSFIDYGFAIVYVSVFEEGITDAFGDALIVAGWSELDTPEYTGGRSFRYSSDVTEYTYEINLLEYTGVEEGGSFIELWGSTSISL